MSNANKSKVDSIRSQLGDDWKVLESIYKLLHDEKAFCVADCDKDEKIVNFVQPHELKKLIDLSIEDDATRSGEEILAICRRVINYSVKTSHKRFHNQLFGQMDPYGLAGSWITEALNTSAYTYEMAPVFSLIETEIIKKMCKVCGYDKGDGIFSPGGSVSNMYALVLARYKRYPHVKSNGMFGMRPLVFFTSEESHYSFKKAAHWLGLGADNCVVVRTNGYGQMLVSDLLTKIAQVQNEGREPFFVNATAGTTVLGAFDDLHAIADVCEKYDLWMHVDACFGGVTMLSLEHRHLISGIERSNSLAWNPHKALGAPLQCALFLTRDSELLAQCNSLEVTYLFQQDKFYDVSYDTGNKSVQCGRKIDAFKLWVMLKARGLQGYGCLVDHALNMAQLMLTKLRQRGEDRGFRLVQEQYQFTNICFWYIPKKLRGLTETDEWRERLYSVGPKIKERMMLCGSLMVGYSPLPYRNLGNFIRMILTCFPVLDEAEVDFILDEIERLGEEIEC